MKRTISSFLGLLLISVPLFASTIEIISSTANNLTVEVSLPEVEFTEREYPDGNIYTVLRVHGSGTWEIGNPAVPCFGNWILIPNGTSVHITTYPGKPVIYENIDLPPVQPPLPDIRDAPIPHFVKNQETYKADRDYPGEFALIGPVKQMRGQDCTILWIFPYQYNPVSKILKVYPNLRVSIDFKGIIRPIPPNLKSRQYERKMLGMAINAKEVLDIQKSLEENEQNKSKSTGAELLIITHDNFESAANTLSDWKTKTGIPTRVAKTSVIGNTTTDIESYIDSAVANWSPAPEYLLLLGDAEFVPTWYENLHPRASQGHIGTDIFYADINSPPDYIADLGYGRLPVDTPDEADSLVARIIRYEKIANPTTYYTDATMAAAFQDGASGDPPDSIANRRFAKTSEDVRNYLESQGYITERVYATYNGYDNSDIFPKYWNDEWWAVFENDTLGGEIPVNLQKPTFPWNAITTDVSNAINNGTFFILHRNHGARSGWGEPHFRKWHVDALNNGELRPIVWSINCNTGWFDNETDDDSVYTDFYSECFIEHWLRHPTGGGIGLIASSRVSWSGINDRLAWGWMDAIWPGFLTWCNDPYGGPERIYAMGDLLNYGKAYMITKYSWNEFIRATLEQFHWFGDPTMVIWTDIPEMMAVSYPLDVPLGLSNFTVYVENASTSAPIESSWVCVMKGDKVYERGFTDALGNITFSISPSTVGTLWVSTRAENYITNQGSALVVHYGDVAPMAIINPPDTLFVDSTYLPEVWIMNMGTDTIPIFDVICTIDTSGVPVYIDMQSISNIAGGDSAFATFTGWTVPFARESYKVTVSTFGQFLIDTVPLNDTLEITVQEYNDPPLVAGLPDTNFSEDDTLCIDLTIYVSDSDDPDSDLNWSYSIYAKKGVLIVSVEKIGTKGLNLPVFNKSGPIYVDIDTITHIVTITADPNWNGTRNIVFTAEDPWSLTDADTMMVTVLSVNDPPVIDSVIPSSPCTILIDSVLSLRVFANDVDGDSLSYDWSINGVFDTTTIDPVYSYSCSVQVIDTVMVEASDGILKDSTQWIIAVIDTTAPPVPSLISPDSGWITNDNIPTFIWHVSAGATRYRIKIDNDTIELSDTTHISSPLSEGTHSWCVKAGDAAGNWSAYSSIWTVTVDTTPPSAPQSLLANGSSPSPWTNDSVFVVNWTNPSDMSGIAKTLYKLSSAPTSNYDTTGSLSPIPPVSVSSSQEDSRPLYVWLVDGAGNLDYNNNSSVNLRYDITPPDTVTLISPSDVEYLNNSTVNFVWNKASDNLSGVDRYVLQYALDSGFTQGLVETTTVDTVFTTVLSDTIYYWHVKAVDVANNEGAFSTTWQFELDTQIPDVPTLVSPTGGIYINNSAVGFEWSEVTKLGKATPLAASVRYILQIDTTLVFSNPVAVETVATTYDTVNLSDQDYYWRVRAYDLAGNQGSFASPDSFGVDITAPSIPQLASPDSGIITNDSTITFVWYHSTDNLSGVDYYILEYANNSNFMNATAESLSDTSYTTDLPDTVYYWRVKSVDIATNESSWSSIRSFLIDTQGPTAPVLISPTDGVATNDSTPTFIWHSSTDEMSGVSYYTLQYTIDSSFTSLDSVNTVDTTVTSPIGLSDTIYYWRVQSIDSAGNKSGWSNIWSFEIDTEMPDAPTLVSPVDGEHLDTLSVVFEWNEVVKGIVGSRQYGVGSDGRTVSSRQYAVSRGQCPISLDCGKALPGLTRVEGRSPLPHQEMPPTFSYHNPKSKIYYILQVDTVPGFTSPIIDTTSLTSDTLILNQGLHYWRVRAFDMAGNQGGFSDSSLFVIDTTFPVIDSTTELPDTVAFWGPFTVNTKVADNFSIKDVILYFRINSGEWVVDTMAGSGNWYEGEISEQTPADTIIIDYYITASDSADNLSRDPQADSYSFTLFLTGIEEMRDIPDRFILFAPRPNPSVGMVELKYGLPERADIGLSIYDIQGRLVEVVYRGKRDAGYHKLKIDSRDLSSGIYFIRFQTPGSTHLKKLIILR